MLQKPNSAGFFTNNLILLGIVVLLFFLNFYSKTLFFHPRSIHQWRQADCLSITKNYYEEGMHFFQPKIHYQGPKGGKAVSEFPILNYTVAALWKVFGEHEFIYRLLEYIIYLLGIFILFNTIARSIGSWLLAFFAVSLLLTSPLLTYYSLNFIADVPAFSISVMCFCLFIQFYQTKKPYLFYLSLFCGTLAVLMKASALMPLGLLYFFSCIDIFKLNGVFKTAHLFTKKTLPLVFIIFSLLLIVFWYRFALSYNLNDTNNIFLLTVLPIWDMDEADIIRNLKVLCGDLFKVFLNGPMLFLFFTLVFFVIAKFRSLSAVFKYAFVFTALYFIFYLLFFFKVFSVHDYYLINLMIFPVVTLFCFCELVYQTNFLQINLAFVRVFLIVVLIFNAFNAAAIYRLRMIEDDKLIYWFPFVSKEDQKLYKYLFWDYGNSIKKLEEFRPALREHGIKREELVLTVPDQSFNIALYFMDQKGHAISREHFMLDSTVTEKFRHRHIKYFIMSDTTLKLQTSFKKISPYLESYFKHNGVEVFKIKPGF